MTRMMDVECRQKGIDGTKVRGWRMKRTNNMKKRIKEEPGLKGNEGRQGGKEVD